MAGRAEERAFAQPLTLEELADALGRSAVHVGRSLQVLRDRGLVVTQDRVVTIPDLAALRAYAGFDPGYLHLDRPLEAGPVEVQQVARRARRGAR